MKTGPLKFHLQKVPISNGCISDPHCIHLPSVCCEFKLKKLPIHWPYIEKTNLLIHVKFLFILEVASSKFAYSATRFCNVALNIEEMKIVSINYNYCFSFNLVLININNDKNIGCNAVTDTELKWKN